MPFSEYMKEETEEAFQRPRAGDRFTEMYAFWVYVLRVHDGVVTIMEANPPCELPRDGKVCALTIYAFRQRYAYKSIPGYSVRLVDRNNDVSGWIPKRVGKLEDSYDYQI